MCLADLATLLFQCSTLFTLVYKYVLKLTCFIYEGLGCSHFLLLQVSIFVYTQCFILFTIVKYLFCYL